MQKPAILAFVGHSGSGKTTIIEKVISNLKSEGLRVGTIKHTHHDVELDKPGKDSHRHREAGAEKVAIVGPDRIGIIMENPDTDDPVHLAKFFFSTMDIVIIEGFKEYNIPRIEVFSDPARNPLFSRSEYTVEALCTDLPVKNIEIPHFPRDEIREISTWIRNRFSI
jgi:molybdopterin-guanine dinucleotide biosynthesis protein MobB